jgi:diguanylate cyclase (GGDEF)-like protein
VDSGRPIAAEEWAAARAVRKGETSIDEEIRIQCFDGSSKTILNSAIPLRDAVGNINGAIVVNQDITSRKQVEEQLREAMTALDAANQELQQVLMREQLMARTDHLTGISNRRHFFEVSEQLFTVAQRYQTPLSVLMFDIDHFKRINDKYGHQAGDTLLKCVALIADQHVREADILARYGGEEFIVMLPNTSAREALAAAENIREQVAACQEIGTCNDARITISVGIASILPGEDSLNRLIQRADQALYSAKNAGRNCSKVFAAAQ